MDFEQEIKNILKKEVKEEIILEKPISEFGDYAFPCFELAKKLKKNPVEIAKELANKIKLNKSIEKIEAKGPYLNFFVNKDILVNETIAKILKEKDEYGNGNEKEKIMIEFSQANTHKAFHVGHIRGTSIGESLARIFEFRGNNVIRSNYQGDIGMHVAKWIWCYLKYHSKEGIKKDESWFAKIYVEAVKRLNEKPEFQDEVDGINRRLDSKEDKKLLELWKKTRKICLDSLEIIYKELNTKFDKYFFESELEENGKKISKELVNKGIAKISDGATIIDLEKFGLSVWVLLRKDETVLYSAKDIALAEKKFKEFKIDKAISIVGEEQNLHFQQLFKTLELMNFKQVKNYKHVGFGLVKLPEGKMSSRTGDNILYSDFKNEVVDYAKKEIKKRYPKISNLELDKRALAIAIAAMKYDMLKQDPNRTIIFIKEEALNFEGNSGPYIQYSYARAASILRKAKLKPKASLLKEKEELEIISKIAEFPEIAKKSSEELKPSLIANYAYELAKLFNEFYQKYPVLKADKNISESRLALVLAVKQAIKNSLNLLGIDVVEKM